ncbi:leucine Rich Repeat [Seminavis robusta]|uniref:Leucine Rich Repeat n=1 Tax=Seminavis robusta TaxID=568900 RepID=A0A9N8E5V8_9STRA|nr:leucine Rich Repeat [Seminavis robusta]|eukprot:Sro694_g188460.1 leucine Rich Repeat (855) ;mRNA; r:15299-17939
MVRNGKGSPKSKAATGTSEQKESEEFDILEVVKSRSLESIEECPPKSPSYESQDLDDDMVMEKKKEAIHRLPRNETLNETDGEDSIGMEVTQQRASAASLPVAEAASSGRLSDGAAKLRVAGAKKQHQDFWKVQMQPAAAATSTHNLERNEMITRTGSTDEDSLVMEVVQQRASAASLELADAGRVATSGRLSDGAAKLRVAGAKQQPAAAAANSTHKLERNEVMTMRDSIGGDSLVMQVVQQRASSASLEMVQRGNSSKASLVTAQEQSQPGAYMGSPGRQPSRVRSLRFSLVGQGDSAALALQVPEGFAGQSGDDIRGSKMSEKSSVLFDGTEHTVGMTVRTASDLFAEKDTTSLDLEAGRRARGHNPTNIWKHIALGGALALLAVIVALVVVVVLLKQQQQPSQQAENNQTPTIAHSAAMKELAIRSALASHVGEHILNAEDTPYQAAMDWILHKDPMQLDVFSGNLIQRYVLALFYYKTSQGGPWISCNPPEEGKDNTCFVNEFAKNQTGDIVYQKLDEPDARWLSEKHECEWAMVQCSPGRDQSVVGLDILGQDLSGTMPEELRYLKQLRWLSLSHNPLTGTIPAVYGEIPYLTIFKATQTFITGQIPASFLDQPNLSELSLSHTLITGTIPPEIGGLSRLKHLFLFDTAISGSLPTEMGLLEDVQNLWLFDNRQLSGALPSELGKLSLLDMLKLGANNHTGPIPSELGDLGHLEEFSLTGNDMGGTPLPEEIWSWSSLQLFDISQSNFGGTISTQIGQMTSLQGLKAAGNDFSGTLPSEIGLLSNLQLLWLHRNEELEGEMPSEVCQLRGLSALQILYADCGGSNPQISCPSGCCTGCCDNEGSCGAV